MRSVLLPSSVRPSMSVETGATTAYRATAPTKTQRRATPARTMPYARIPKRERSRATPQPWLKSQPRASAPPLGCGTGLRSEPIHNHTALIVSRNRPVVGCLAGGKIEHHLVDIAPSPTFRRIIAFDER